MSGSKGIKRKMCISFGETWDSQALCFTLRPQALASHFVLFLLARQFDASTVHYTVCYCPDWGGHWIMAPAYTQRVQEQRTMCTTTRTYQCGIVQMPVAFCLALLFSPSFFAYMLYDTVIQLPPGAQEHPHPPSVFAHRIC